MFFQHTREIPQGIVKGWLLEVSDRIAGNLTASYSGDESVRTEQIVVFTGVIEEPGPDEKAEFCDAIENVLVESATDFTILGVSCSNFDYIESGDLFKARHRMLHRGLQGGDAGQLTVEFKVHAEYTPASRAEEEVVKDDEFAKLVEVSSLC